MNDFQEKAFEVFDNDVRLYYCGKRLHNFGHHYGPYVNKEYLMYLVKEGKMTLFYNGKKTELIGPAFFVNFPNSQFFYECAKDVPFSIKWITATGKTIEKYLEFLGVTIFSPFFPLQETSAIENVFDEMYEFFDKRTTSSKVYCVSLVHKLFSLLLKKPSSDIKENDYVLRAKRLIEKHYSSLDFNVSALSKMLNLNANYFSVLFKKITGISPVKALTEHRLNSALKMLKFTNKSIKEIAISCGYEDELYFSRIFKKNFSVSPTIYRTKEEFLT